MGKQNETELLAERWLQPNPLFDHEELKNFVAASDELTFSKSGRQALWLFLNGQLVKTKERK